MGSKSVRNRPTKIGVQPRHKILTRQRLRLTTNDAQMPASAIPPHRKLSPSRSYREGNGELVLKDLVTKVIYKLNDAAKAKQYVGKRVKVNGQAGHEQ